jgi:hypothetical protein
MSVVSFSTNDATDVTATGTRRTATFAEMADAMRIY